MTPDDKLDTGAMPDPSLSRDIIGAAIAVHRTLGSGLLEALYERAMCIELEHRRIPFRSQVPIRTTYRGMTVGDYFADLVVADTVIVELKCVTAFNNAHIAQVLSYMESARIRLGLLLNFNAPVLVRGIKRVVR